MKQSPQDNNLRSRLSASKFSGEGFLGNDTRTLEDIVDTDLHALEELGVTKDDVVAGLDKVFNAAKESLGVEVKIGPTISVLFHESMGRIPSPFRGDGLFEKGEAELTHIPTGKKLFITALGIFLVHAHDFFQGKGSRYRIEPADVVEILSLGK